MRTVGATPGDVSAGLVEIAIRPDPAISQQHGFAHAGAVTAIADSAAGYTVLSGISDWVRTIPEGKDAEASPCCGKNTTGRPMGSGVPSSTAGAALAEGESAVAGEPHRGEGAATAPGIDK